MNAPLELRNEKEIITATKTFAKRIQPPGGSGKKAKVFVSADMWMAPYTIYPRADLMVTRLQGKKE